LIRFNYIFSTLNEGECPYLEPGQSYSSDEIVRLSGKLQASGRKSNTLLFNIRDDPYELHNIYDQETAIGDKMIERIEQLGNEYKNVKEVPFRETKDKAVLSHPKFPGNTRKTTWGWCNADKI